MMCPVCYNKIKHDGNICPVCKFRKDELNTASNLAVKKLLKERRYDDIIQTTQFPEDLSHQKTFLLALFGGWFGLHNFYINKWFKAIFNVASLVLMFILSILMYFGVFGEEYLSLALYGGVFYVATLLMWVMDLVSLLTKSFKVPVVLKKNIEKEQKDDKD